MADKWGAPKTKGREAISIHIAVNVKTKEILALDVTD